MFSAQVLSNVKNKEVDGDLLFAMEDDEVPKLTQPAIC